MKRTLLTVVPLACVSATAIAQDAGSRFDGFYVGAEGGILNSFANVDSTASTNFYTTGRYYSSSVSVGGNLSNNQSNKLNANFGAGAFSLGVGKVMQRNLYVGAELALNIANRKNAVLNTSSQSNTAPGPFALNSTATLTTNTQAKLNFAEFDIDLKGGVVVSPDTLALARVGIAFNRLHVSSNNVLTVNDNIAPDFGFPSKTVDTLNYSGSKNEIGVRFGLGAEHFVFKNLVAKIDYVYTWYGSSVNASSTLNKLNPGGVPTIFPGSTTTLKGFTSASMNTQAVLAGISYYFDQGYEK